MSHFDDLLASAEARAEAAEALLLTSQAYIDNAEPIRLRLERSLEAAEATIARVEAWRRDWIHGDGDTAAERELVEALEHRTGEGAR